MYEINLYVDTCTLSLKNVTRGDRYIFIPILMLNQTLGIQLHLLLVLPNLMYGEK